MANGGEPYILIVDDEPDQLAAFAADFPEDVGVDTRHPRDVTSLVLARAHLVLVDYQLNQWEERRLLARQTPALAPQDGLALAAVLRSQAGPVGPPKAFALHSAHLEEAAATALPSEYSEHALARLHDLEWVFSKSDTAGRPPRTARAVSLAEAVRTMPPRWPSTDDEAALAAQRLLALDLDGPAWNYTAWEAVRRAGAPLDLLAAASQGLAFLRWLLHRVLPYPSFLLDPIHVAALIGLDGVRAEEALTAGPLADALGPARYRGILNEFDGPRWWGAAIDQVLWSLTDGQSGDRDVIGTVLASLDPNLSPTYIDEPVVVLNENLEARRELRSAAECVRLQPDDWPPQALQAWAHVEDAKTYPTLHAAVIEDDRHRLNPEA